MDLRNISVRHPWTGLLSRPRHDTPVVNGVTLEIGRGEVLGLVGESGSGKTSLARAIMRLVDSEGSMRLADQPWSDLDQNSLRVLRPRVQMVFQDPYSSLNPRLTVGQCLEEALGVRAPDTDAASAVTRLLEDVGLPADAAARYPHAFSGGQRQRIAIARALAPQPDLLIADEPVSALDVTIQARILELMLALVRDRSLTLLFISHDLGAVRRIADRVAVMRAGKLVEVAPADVLFTAPAHEYTRALLAALPTGMRE